MNIYELMEKAAANEASDLHITTGLPPIIRVSVGLKPLCDQIVTPEMSERFAEGF